MNQPLFFQRRPEVVQAIQYTGVNNEEVLDFLGGVRHLLITKNDWIVKRSDGTIEVKSLKEFQDAFMHKFETL